MNLALPKKLLLLFSAFSFLIFGGACMTSQMYKSQYRPKYFQEEISSFLITEDGKQLVFIGKQHHYIFAATDKLKFILTWPENQRIRAKFEAFNIELNQTVTGRLQLMINVTNDLSNKDKTLLTTRGFIENQSAKTLRLTSSLTGKRYLADKFKLPAAMQFKEKYVINMAEQQSPTVAGMAGRILLTPLTVAADGVMFIAGTPLLLALWVSSANQ